ncbi:hypothetical protein ACS5NO_15285 [Larkinella sp. GY13]
MCIAKLLFCRVVVNPHIRGELAGGMGIGQRVIGKGFLPNLSYSVA